MIGICFFDARAGQEHYFSSAGILEDSGGSGRLLSKWNDSNLPFRRASGSNDNEGAAAPSTTAPAPRLLGARRRLRPSAACARLCAAPLPDPNCSSGQGYRLKELQLGRRGTRGRSPRRRASRS